MSIDDIVRLLTGQVSVVFLLVLILITGMRGIWVWGYQLKAAEKRADDWEERFLVSLDQSGKATHLAQRMAGKR